MSAGMQAQNKAPAVQGAFLPVQWTMPGLNLRPAPHRTSAGANPFRAAEQPLRPSQVPTSSPAALWLLSNVWPKLMIGQSSDPLEDEADRVADQVMRTTVASSQISHNCSSHQREQSPPLRAERHASEEAAGEAPAMVADLLGVPGRALDAGAREFMEPRLGRDLSEVRIHTGPKASRSAEAVTARAYTVGRDVVFGAGEYAPHTAEGRRLLAHELAHVLQHRGTGTVHRYRSKSSFAFGERDTATLVEQSFDPRKDKETKPWIELVTVEFTGTDTDAEGSVFSTGTATVHYHDNPVKLADFTFKVTGGSPQLGPTTAGTSFTVSRIEGYGYNSGSASGTPGVDFNWSEREGPNKRYSKQDPAAKDRDANMSFAVFYHRGEALHAGPRDFSSHGCVHVDWDDEDLMKQVNYHSVIGLTRVNVSYSTP